MVPRGHSTVYYSLLQWLLVGIEGMCPQDCGLGLLGEPREVVLPGLAPWASPQGKRLHAGRASPGPTTSQPLVAAFCGTAEWPAPRMAEGLLWRWSCNLGSLSSPNPASSMGPPQRCTSQDHAQPAREVQLWLLGSHRLVFRNLHLRNGENSSC